MFYDEQIPNVRHYSVKRERIRLLHEKFARERGETGAEFLAEEQSILLSYQSLRDRYERSKDGTFSLYNHILLFSSFTLPLVFQEEEVTKLPIITRRLMWGGIQFFIVAVRVFWQWKYNKKWHLEWEAIDKEYENLRERRNTESLELQRVHKKELDNELLNLSMLKPRKNV